MSSASPISVADTVHGTALPERSTRGVYVGFASLVTVGLALAGWYVGERIFDAEPTRPGPTRLPVVTQRLVPVQAVSEAGPVLAQSPVAIAPAPEVQPVLPQYYLQVATLGTAQDLKFLKRLEKRGYNAHVETSAGDPGGQILIGPYTEASELGRARRRLAAAGILAMETAR
jgi:cell division septation protein DedD